MYDGKPPSNFSVPEILICNTAQEQDLEIFKKMKNGGRGHRWKHFIFYHWQSFCVA